MKIFYCIVSLLLVHTAVSAQSISGLLSKLHNTTSDTDRMNLYTDVFLHYLYVKNDSAEYYAQEGYDYFRQKQNKLGQGKTINMLAAVDITRGRMDLAEKKYKDALVLFEEVHDTKGAAAMENNLGEAASKQGRFDEGMRYFFESLKISERTHDTDNILETYIKIGAAYNESNGPDKALEYFDKAAKVQENRPMSVLTLTLYNNIGTIYGQRGNFQAALDNFNKAIALSANNNRYTGIRVMSFMNAGIAYSHLGNMASANADFDTSLKIATEQNMPDAKVKVFINMASTVSEAQPRKGLELLQKALAVAKEANLQELEDECYKSLVDAYTELKDYKSALTTLQAERVLNDSLFSIEKEKDIANLQANYDLEKSQANVRELKVLTYKNTRDKNILIAVALIIITFSAVLLFYYRKTLKLNDQLYKQQEALQTLNGTKDKLFSIIGHDLRGPVANIPVMLQIYEDTTDTEEKSYIFNELKEHVQASTETLDKLLYWGQSQMKGTRLHQVDFDTKEYITKTIHLVKSAADQKHIHIQDNTPDGLSAHAEPVHFEFVIRNLLSNAIKFTHPDGNITLFSDQEQLPGYIVFGVKDNGTGIDPEHLKTIFQPFGKSKKGTADEKGTSIGLMLCKEFITANGGNIWVESEVGKGTTFYFSLKAVTSAV